MTSSGYYDRRRQRSHGDAKLAQPEPKPQPKPRRPGPCPGLSPVAFSYLPVSSSWKTDVSRQAPLLSR